MEWISFQEYWDTRLNDPDLSMVSAQVMNLLYDEALKAWEARSTAKGG
jgi:hypothetical protein